MENEIQKKQGETHEAGPQEVKPKSLTFENDQQYFDEYADIYTLMVKRLRLLDKEREGRFSHRTKNDLCGLPQNNSKILEFTRAIEVKEWLFWEKAARSLHEGRTFVIEEMSKHYGLGHFEKRLFLLLLCDEINSERYGALNRTAIISSLCLTGTFSEKLKCIPYFDDSRALFGKRLLTMDEWRDGYRVDKFLLQVITKKASGMAVDWPPFNLVKEDNEVEKVGFVREPEVEMGSVVLDHTTKERVQHFVTMHKSEILKEIYSDKFMKRCRGLSFLFYGPSGTGKSLLAEAVAKELNKKMLIVETSKIFNSFVGETDKNISAMFKAAKNKDMLLLLDEADSLLYSRDIAASDFKVRFVNVMLTELERFEGIVVFTSNMDGLLDPALERRVALKVKFELPTIEMRKEMWRTHIPSVLGIADDVDFERLAKQFEFSGGNIRNAVMNAVRCMAINSDRSLKMHDLVRGAQLEQEGMYAKKNKKVIKGFSF